MLIVAKKPDYIFYSNFLTLFLNTYHTLVQEYNAQMVEQERQEESNDNNEVVRIAEIQKVFDDLVTALQTQPTQDLLAKIVQTARSDLSPQDSLEIYITNITHQRIDHTPASQSISGLVNLSGLEGETYYIQVTTPADQAQGKGPIITELSLSPQRDALEITEKRSMEGVYVPTRSCATIYPHEIVGIKIVPTQR